MFPQPHHQHQTFHNYPPSPDQSAPNHLEPHHASFIEELYGVPRKPRNFRQWEEAARLHMQDLKQNGSPSPLVWVLVKGKDIPANAIVAGEEKRQPLYIARTFYEGVLSIGKAGRQLERGASIAYNGREVHVDTYEVLVPALQTIRYMVSDTSHIHRIPRMVGHKHEFQSPVPVPVSISPDLQRLNLIKTVVLVDDSASMAGTLWRDAREALAGIVDLNSKVSTDGVDLYFMNDPRSATNLKNAGEVHHLFESVVPIGETPTGRKLQELFDTYLPLVEDRYRQHRPITLVVITDGVPTDEPEGAIINAARRLDRNQVPPKRFGIQFAQIGDDPEATDFLRELDDDLYVRHNCRDIVDTTPFNPTDRLFTSEKMVKILLGAIDKNIERAASPLLSPAPLLASFG